MRRVNNQRGDTIIEVLFAMTIIGVVLAAAYSIASQNLQVSLLAKERTHATQLAEAQLEQLKAIDDLNELEDGVYCLDVSATEGDEVIMSYNPDDDEDECVEDFYTKTITKDGSQYKVLVEWIPPGGSEDNKARVQMLYHNYDYELASSSVINLDVDTDTNPNGVVLSVSYGSQPTGDCGVVYGRNVDNLAVNSDSEEVTVIRFDNCTEATDFNDVIEKPESSGTYTIRAFVQMSGGSYRYSAASSFDVDVLPLPSVETVSATAKGYTTADLIGSVGEEAGQSVIERGFVLSKNQMSLNENNYDRKIPSNDESNEFEATVGNLLPGTTYYVRAYATNESGTSVGEIQEFTTQDIVADNSNLENSGEFNGSTYYLYTERVTWERASEIATDLGGHLATISSQTENDFVSEAADGNRAWIGLYVKEEDRTTGTGRTWSWVTGETHDYRNWNPPAEPNNAFRDGSYEDYAVMNWSGGKWNDRHDFDEAYFVIEFSDD